MVFIGAHDRSRTGDLILTKDALYQLSYVGFLCYTINNCGAGNETRTRNPQLGRLMLYQLSYSRSEYSYFTEHIMVEGGGFEPPKAEPTDLQSVPFGRSGTPPGETSEIDRHSLYSNKPFVKYYFKMELAIGLEPTTTSLQVRSSTIELRQLTRPENILTLKI
jgi:hypothetical protein